MIGHEDDAEVAWQLLSPFGLDPGNTRLERHAPYTFHARWLDTWRQVLTDWEHDGVAEKIFGDAKTSRAVVIRTNDGNPVDGPRRCRR